MIDRLKEVIHDSGLSNRKFSVAIGLSENAISEVLNGRTNLSHKALITIKDKYNISPNWLLTGELPKLLKKSTDAGNGGNAASRVKVRFDENGLPITEIIPVDSKKSKTKSADVVSLEGLTDEQRKEVLSFIEFVKSKKK